MEDKYGRKIDYLRISVTDNCNLRCIYCMKENHNDFLSSDKKLTDNEIYRIVLESAKLGIKKIRFTGGEPLVRKDIMNLIGRINKIEGIEEIYLTTNGILLLDQVENLAANGVKGVNISLDSLKPDRFKTLTRRGELKKVLEVIDKCIEHNIKVKLNTVIIGDINQDEILDFVELTKQKAIDVRFIELMPIGQGKLFKPVKNTKILEIIKSEYKELAEINRNISEGPAKYIRVNNSLGRVGFISAISNCFCDYCNRIRITPDGFLKQCLHWNYGVDLRTLLRNGISNEELNNIIKNNIYNKPEKHLFNEQNKNEEIRFMNEIGG
ncbi:GTP 3',8-cyclase MoaA [Clostridium gasigenes]|uniref:GTP 3',8-cyclase n=1 Tax=Clostridium gasigenes TaxID=94869 RepID=A0A1H0SPB4_9CLOT|nr:GTP 3',8-cyclase MoaA [Clostridium gasigenes]MBB6623480.1 GTP 3',8-cyclase MoaA [Clostridium gasigenes]NKF07826.1 GTP 3',8-cyclase MoaA [Clostridium gasigenes]QSW20406.1 GTP 3',8-cyclase MoaA [Clostridium gasigenes]SDP43550.1 cyclic pyranopterin monophosphate synthase subunit MoaA [Clostridium gasigenes]